MTPEEKTVIDLAIEWRRSVPGSRTPLTVDFESAIERLIFSCPQCNWGGHTCPGDGNVISHTDTDCGEHEDDKLPAPMNITEQERWSDLWASPKWVETTMLFALAGDRIRIGAEETNVLRSTSGVWHVNNADAWHPTPWKHTELRMELEAVPGFVEYPPAASIEISMTLERRAVHTIMLAFPGASLVDAPPVGK